MRNDFESNKKRILEYLQSNSDGLTVTTALKIFHTTELRSYVKLLRKDGYKIVDEWVLTRDKYGINHRFKRYWLENEEVANA